MNSKLLVLLAFFSSPWCLAAQVDSVQPVTKIVVAGPQYKKSSFHQILWGKHYRKDWVTPVKVYVIYLDTVNGGLTAYEKGGGRQSKTLRLRNAAGKEYVLRSIDKSFGRALPEIYRGTFIETIINDQVSIAPPYAALSIPGMAEAAGIYHTKPEIVYVPSQKALGEFEKDFGNNLYLFEQRPDENWEEAPNFGNSKKIVGTDKMLEKILEDNDNTLDQQAYVRARLFDMFIGDWGRHEDQWRWASFKDGDKTLYKPIPRDRDQAYTKFDGILLSFGLSAADVDHLESFGKNIRNVSTYNYPARNLDRKVANAVPKEQWLQIAKSLQEALTDAVIQASVSKLPPEVSKTGEGLITRLKARRDRLMKFAEDYYKFLADEVEVTGTKKDEYFAVKTNASGATVVEVFDLNKEGKPKNKPFYSRAFNENETDEVRIYGISGNDRFVVEGSSSNKIKIRLIGGPMKDIYMGDDNAADKIHVYDNAENDFSKLKGGNKHLSKDSSVHLYNYEGFHYDEKGPGLVLSYSSPDHIHVGLKYDIEKQKWRKFPFAYTHRLAAQYSISEDAVSFGYEGRVTQFIGKWNLHLDADYDFIRWYNFYGIGNETEMETTERDFHRVRTKEFSAGGGLNTTFANYHRASFTLFYQGIDIINDPGRFLTKQRPPLTYFDTKYYGVGKFEYSYQNVNDHVVPTKGLRFFADVNYAQNLKQTDSAVTTLSSILNIYLPLSNALVFSIKAGGATVRGQPEFFQLAKLGGGKTLRGFRKYRFYGTSMLYNQAELQFIPNIRTWWFNGRAGVIALYDIGRVWHPSAISSTWHHGYGAGIMIAPFNKLSIAAFYGRSKNENAYSFRFTKGL